jgi:DinB superfamily
VSGIVSSLKSITENLARAEKKFLSAADAVPADHWKTKPSQECWSASEVVCHLIMVERAVIKGAERLLQQPPKPRPFLKRFHLPLWAAESRVMRLKSPIPLDAGLIGEKEPMLEQLRKVRERTLAFLDNTSGRELSNYHMPHPFLGTLNAYEWFQLIASHEVRHSKQIKEIAGALPKSVTTLEK